MVYLLLLIEKSGKIWNKSEIYANFLLTMVRRKVSVKYVAFNTIYLTPGDADTGFNRAGCNCLARTGDRIVPEYSQWDDTTKVIVGTVESYLSSL